VAGTTRERTFVPRAKGGDVVRRRRASTGRPVVLLVDDVASNLFALEAMLRRDDADIVKASCGQEALEILLDRPIAVAIIDVQMPEMDGFDLAALMRGTGRTRHVPIIFVTAASRDDRRVFAGYEAGAVDFLFKPIDPHVLRSKVDVFVTLEKQRNALRRSEERFRSLVQTTSQAVWRTEPDGEIVDDSPGFRALTGMSADDWLAGRVFDAIHPDDRERVKAIWADALASESACEVEHRIMRPDGRFTWTLVHFAPVRDDRGELVEWVVANTDIEERKEAENLRETFVAILGHDLRSPLGAILTTTELVLGHTTDPKVRGWLKRAQSSGQRMGRMIDQLLDLTRVRLSSGIALAPAQADLASIVNHALSEIAHDRECFRVEIEGSTQGTWDVDRLLQVVSNLACNAVDHGPQGTTIGVRVDGNSPDTVVLRVHNAGPAIPPQVRQVLFEPFRGTTQNRASRGLGLGLFITKLLVNAHGGDVDFETSDEAGTTFRVTLPRHTGIGLKQRRA
jgi:PAS domain S-box-containing protein